MGYYIEYSGSISYPSYSEGMILQALRDLNKRHDLKSGRSMPKPEGLPEELQYDYHHFSWLTGRWHEEPEIDSVARVLEMLGFDVSTVEHEGFTEHRVYYDNKQGDEEHFIATIAQQGALVEIEAKGEDREQWLYHTSPLENELLVSEALEVQYGKPRPVKV